MATIIRVKRRLTEDPVEAVVLASKRLKTADEADHVNTVLDFSGTVDDKDNRIATKAIKSYCKKDYMTHIPDISSKKRSEQRERSEKNRFKVISCLRATASDIYSDAECLEDAKYTIVDVKLESEVEEVEDTCEASSSSHNYVYDLYSISNATDDINDIYMDNLISIHPVASDFQYRCGEDMFDEENIGDDSDSNDEGNWRNDYPDSDHSINDTDMVLAAQMRGFGLDDGIDLSSDDGEDKYLNYSDSLAAELAGSSYARYKGRITQALDEADQDDECFDSDREEAY